VGNLTCAEAGSVRTSGRWVTCALPGLFSRLGTDPAYGAGGSTVVQNVLSLLIYSWVVTVVVGWGRDHRVWEADATEPSNRSPYR
jgi:hypothetical protein